MMLFSHCYTLRPVTAVSTEQHGD